MAVAVFDWYSEPLDALAECEDGREVGGGSADERGWRDGGTETKEPKSSDGLRA
jgi:hypothetical protein